MNTRIRIRSLNWMRILADPDTQPWMGLGLFAEYFFRTFFTHLNCNIIFSVKPLYSYQGDIKL